MEGFVIRGLTATEAQMHGDRLRGIFRAAVLAVAPSRHTKGQVAVWAESADEIDRWAPWLADGTSSIAVTCGEPEQVVGFALRYPADYLHLLYVDPDFQRRGLGGALLAAADGDAHRQGVASLRADASLFSYPVFLAAGYVVVAWEEVEHKGQVFPRANLSKTLR